MGMRGVSSIRQFLLRLESLGGRESARELCLSRALFPNSLDLDGEMTRATHRNVNPVVRYPYPGRWSVNDCDAITLHGNIDW